MILLTFSDFFYTSWDKWPRLSELLGMIEDLTGI